MFRKRFQIGLIVGVKVMHGVERGGLSRGRGIICINGFVKNFFEGPRVGTVSCKHT
jgi:hypothetical protein